jgi:broad specificity phosphatase PhoE
MRLILVRHGEAHAGFHGPIAGSRGCAGLTDRGRIQAQVLRDVLGRSRWMHADVLLSSVLPRAVETAEIIAPGLDLELASRDCDLCEVHTGAADGLLWSEYAERYEAFDMEDEPDRPFAPGGESWNGFHQRVAGALDRLVATYDGRTVMVVCHAGVIVASMRLLLQMPLAGARVHLRPSNTGITEWTHDASSGRWTLHTFNDASHLLGLGEDSAARPLPSGSERPEHEYSVESARDAVERGRLPTGWRASSPARAATMPCWANRLPSAPTRGSGRCASPSIVCADWRDQRTRRCSRWWRSTSGAMTSPIWRNGSQVASNHRR